ncbi:hypothetical protein ACFLV0_03935 [Chloroflexota bacterium]
MNVICVGQLTSKFPEGDIEPPTEADAFTGHIIAARIGLTPALMLKTSARVNRKRTIQYNRRQQTLFTLLTSPQFYTYLQESLCAPVRILPCVDNFVTVENQIRYYTPIRHSIQSFGTTSTSAIPSSGVLRIGSEFLYGD